MAVFCQYKCSAKIIKFTDPMEIPCLIATAFQLKDVEVSIQYLDADFDEYVDLDDFSAIINKMKLRVVEMDSVSSNITDDSICTPVSDLEPDSPDISADSSVISAVDDHDVW